MLCVLRGLGDYQSLSIELSGGISWIDVKLVEIDTVTAVIFATRPPIIERRRRSAKLAQQQRARTICHDNGARQLTARKPATVGGGSDSKDDIRETEDTNPTARGQAPRSRYGAARCLP